MTGLVRFAPLPTIKELLTLYDIRAMRDLSQNFLLDLRLAGKIVKAAGDISDSEVCEIGAGPGPITRCILNSDARKLIAIEKDTRFTPILESLQHAVKPRLEVVYADVLNYDFSQSFDNSLKKDWTDSPPKIHLIGNLPFNVANPLLIRFLKDISLRRNAWSYGRVRLTLTFQEEVARRISSEILSKSRCRLSVMCQNWCKISYKFKIRGAAFLPKADVNVGVIHIEPLVKPLADLEFHIIEKVARTIFNCRQKYSIKSASNLFPKELRNDLGMELFKIADLDPQTRPYEISSEDWIKIFFAYKQICDRNPSLYKYDFRGPKSSRETVWKADEI